MVIKSISHDSHRVYVQLNFNREVFNVFLEQSKRLKFYYWSKAKSWVFDKKDARAKLSYILKKLGYSDEQTIGILKSSTPNEDKKNLFSCKIHPVLDSDDEMIVFINFDWTITFFFKSLGAIFDRTNKAWIVSADIEDLIEGIHDRCGLSYDNILYYDSPLRIDRLSNEALKVETDEVNLLPESARNILEKSEQEFETITASILHSIDKIETKEYDKEAVESFCKKIGAMPHQVEGIKFLLSRTSCLLADDMGLGKTLQAIVAGHFIEGPKFVLCPKSLKRNWANEIKKWTGNENVFVVNSLSDTPPEGKDWYIFNYRASGIASEFVATNKIKIGAVFFDEAHELKNPRTQQSRNSFEVAFYAKNRIIITGTPVLNRLQELHTLLMLSGHKLGSMPKNEFLNIYAGSARKTRELKDSLDGTWMISRDKSILGDAILGKKEQIVEIDMSPSQEESYYEIFRDPETDSLVKFNHLRKMLEDIKVAFISEQVKSLSDKHKAIIFCEYVENIDRLVSVFEANDIECVSFSGRDSSTKRDNAIEAIQNGSARVFVATTKSAGVGITLTKADYIFFATLPWTQALKSQAEDRANRIGQKNVVKVVTPLVNGTIDKHLKKILDTKKVISECVVKDILSPDVEQVILSES